MDCSLLTLLRIIDHGLNRVNKYVDNISLKCVVTMSSDIRVRKLEEIIEEIEKLIERLEKSDLQGKENIIGKLEDLVENAEDVIVEISGKKSDTEELREVLGVVAPFLKDLGSTMKDILDTALGKLTEFLDGKKLGENIASLYENLKKTGMPDQMINEIVKEYVRKLLESAPDLSSLLKNIFSGLEISPSIGKKKHGEINKKGEEKPENNH